MVSGFTAANLQVVFAVGQSITNGLKPRSSDAVSQSRRVQWRRQSAKQ
jgi:hypothetical protein